MTTAPERLAAPPAPRCAALLAETCRRLVSACPALVADVVSQPPVDSYRPGGRVSGAELAARPDLLDAFVDGEAVRVRTRYGHEARPDVAATRALHHYLWSVCLLMSGPWYLERRVPLLSPQDVHVDLGSGDITVAPGGFVCLPDDPAAHLPGVRVVPHEEALRAELRAVVADHVRPLLSAAGPSLRRGPRALWGMVGDDLVSGVWYLGRMLGEESRSVRAATDLLPAAIAPFPSGAAFRQLTTDSGTTQPTRTRVGCCLYYTIRPAEACGTCPRVCDGERLRRIEEL